VKSPITAASSVSTPREGHLADAVENILASHFVAALRLEALKLLVEGRDIPGQPTLEEGCS